MKTDTMQKSIETLANPEYRPNRETAKGVWLAHIKPHAGVTPLDESPFDQELIEIILDARMVIRNKLNEIFNINDCLSALRAEWIEHQFLSNTINRFDSRFGFTPVAGYIRYHWHDVGNDDLPISVNVGSMRYEPEEQVVPVVWSEAMNLAWDNTLEQKRIAEKHGTDIPESNFKTIDSFNLLDTQQDDESSKEHTFDDRAGDDGLAEIRISKGEASLDRKCTPVRLDTTFNDITNSSKIKSFQKSPIQAPRVLLTPMYRGLCGNPLYIANGACTSVFTQSMSCNAAITLAEIFHHHRNKAYKYWRCE